MKPKLGETLTAIHVVQFKFPVQLSWGKYGFSDSFKLDKRRNSSSEISPSSKLSRRRSHADLNEATTRIKIIAPFIQYAAVLRFLKVYFSRLTVASPQVFTVIVGEESELRVFKEIMTNALSCYVFNAIIVQKKLNLGAY